MIQVQSEITADVDMQCALLLVCPEHTDWKEEFCLGVPTYLTFEGGQAAPQYKLVLEYCYYVGSDAWTLGDKMYSLNSEQAKHIWRTVFLCPKKINSEKLMDLRDIPPSLGALLTNEKARNKYLLASNKEEGAAFKFRLVCLTLVSLGTSVTVGYLRKELVEGRLEEDVSSDLEGEFGHKSSTSAHLLSRRQRKFYPLVC